MFSILVALRASSLLMMFKHARINQQNNHKTLYCHVGTIIIATRRKVGLSLQQRKKNLFWSYWLLLACQMTLWCTFTIMTPFLPSSSSTLMGDASLTSTQKQLLGKGGFLVQKIICVIYTKGWSGNSSVGKVRLFVQFWPELLHVFPVFFSWVGKLISLF